MTEPDNSQHAPYTANWRLPMLGDHPVFPILLSTNLKASRAFYHDTLGLDILREDNERIIFRCGAGSQLTITSSTTGTADPQTQLACGAFLTSELSSPTSGPAV